MATLIDKKPECQDFKQQKSFNRQVKKDFENIIAGLVAFTTITTTTLTVGTLSGVLKASAGVVSGSSVLNDIGAPTSSFDFNNQNLTGVNSLSTTSLNIGSLNGVLKASSGTVSGSAILNDIGAPTSSYAFGSQILNSVAKLGIGMTASNLLDITYAGTSSEDIFKIVKSSNYFSIGQQETSTGFAPYIKAISDSVNFSSLTFDIQTTFTNDLPASNPKAVLNFDISYGGLQATFPQRDLLSVTSAGELIVSLNANNYLVLYQYTNGGGSGTGGVIPFVDETQVIGTNSNKFSEVHALSGYFDSLEISSLVLGSLNGVLKSSSGTVSGSAILNDIGVPTSSFSFNSQNLTGVNSLSTSSLTVGSLSGVLKASAGVVSGSAILNDVAAPTSSYAFGSQNLTAVAKMGINSATAPSGSHLKVVATTLDNFLLERFSDTTVNAPSIIGRHAGNTEASPSQTLSGFVLGGLYGQAYMDTLAWTGNIGAIRILASEDTLSTSAGSYIDFAITNTGNTSRAVVARLDYISGVGTLTLGSAAGTGTGKLVTSSISAFTMNGTITGGNNDITNINRLTFNDQGATEGLIFIGVTNPGTNWGIWGSSDAMANGDGDLQIVYGAHTSSSGTAGGINNRVATFRATGGLDISGFNTTTTNVFTVTGDGLTTGGTVLFTSNSSSTSARNIVKILQDHASATSAIALKIQQDAAKTALSFDHTADGDVIDIVQTSVNSANPCYGIKMNISNAGAGLEYAFWFNGQEAPAFGLSGNGGFVSANHGTFTLVDFFRIKVGGTEYKVPYGTAA